MADESDSEFAEEFETWRAAWKATIPLEGEERDVALQIIVDAEAALIANPATTAAGLYRQLACAFLGLCDITSDHPADELLRRALMVASPSMAADLKLIAAA